MALPGIPMVRRGDDLAGLIAAALDRAAAGCAMATCWWWRRKSSPRRRGGSVDLATVTPVGARRSGSRGEVGKDARLVEVVLWESSASCARGRT